MSTNTEEIKLEYAKLLEENGKKVADLPLEIRNQIRGLAPMIKNYNNALDADKPTDAYYKSVVKQDTTIFDAIQSWLEEDLPSKDEFEKQEKERVVKETAAQTQKDEAERVAKELAAKTPEQLAEEVKTHQKSNIVAQETEIREKMKANGGFIHNDDLAKIIGKAPSNTVRIGNLILYFVTGNRYVIN